jgi:hypothetical protein
LLTLAISKGYGNRKGDRGRSSLLSVLPFWIEFHRRFAGVVGVFDRFSVLDGTRLINGRLFVPLFFSAQP